MGIPQHEQDRTVVPSHASCDARAGAQLGNAHRAVKPVPRPVPKVERPSMSFSGGLRVVPGVPLTFLSPATTEDPTGATE